MARRKRSEGGGDGSGDNGNQGVSDFTLSPVDGNGGEAVDPADATGGETASVGSAAVLDNGASSGGSRKRRSDAGQSRGRRSAKNSQSGLEVEGLTFLLYSIHAGVAAATSNPELELDTEDSKRLAAAAKNVADFYDTVISPKAMAWTTLLSTAAMIYSPRLFAMGTRRREEKAARKAAAPAKQAQPMAPPAGPIIHPSAAPGGNSVRPGGSLREVQPGGVIVPSALVDPLETPCQ